MWGRRRKSDTRSEDAPLSPLKEAVHQARIEAAERTSVVVDLRDAEWARLNFSTTRSIRCLPKFRRTSICSIAASTPRRHAAALDRRRRARRHGPRQAAYRFLHDTRIGRHVLAESHEIADIVEAVTTYVARRLVERQRALDEDPEFIQRVARTVAERERRRRRWRAVGAFVFGFFLGLVALFVAGVLIATRNH